MPTLFVPFSVDAYILPRVGLTLLAAATLFGLGLTAGRGALGSLRWPALGVALAAVLAAALSVAPNLSLVGEYSRYESLPVRLAYLGLFFGAAWIGERRRLVAWFVVGCAVASCEALFQWVTGAVARPDGNLGQANLLGALLAMAIPLAVDRARWTSWWLAAAGLCSLGLLASSARSGWLGALVGLCTLTVFRVSARRLRWALAGSVLAVALALAIGLASPLRTLNQDTGAGRVGVWRDTAALVAARPLAGWGEDSFGVVFGRFQSGDWSPGQSFDRAHSMPIDLAASQGLLGLSACSWFFLRLWRGMWRQPRAAGLAGAMAAYLAWSLLNFDWAPATGPFWVLAGAAWSVAGSTPAPSRSRWWRPAVASAGVLAALALAVPAQIADVVYFLGQADGAAALDPLQPRYQAATGGLASLERAAMLNDPDPATYVSLGDARRRAGRPHQAQAAYRRALEIYPFDRQARQRLATTPVGARLASPSSGQSGNPR
jgi:O-antigen ligase